MKTSITKYCMFHRKGMCYFLASEPRPCTLCPNFASASPELKKKLGIDKPVITFWDLVKHDPRLRAFFRDRTTMQMTLPV
ncbi:MAG: hypothetical protein DRN14_03210 [Thermoplasmata archaeon]|nr:hypothetical protein [Thermoplasmata archaeon]RLF28944.1 MAG: hypothetical protein DRN14_03210 [Thermoplasmata archaeon]